MTRYLRQRNLHSCVPIAMINLFKWLGQDCTYKKDFHRISRRLGCDSSGVASKKVREFLATIQGIKVWEEICPWRCWPLNDGEVALISTRNQEGIQHLFLVTKETRCSYYCLNYYDGHRWVLKKKMFPIVHLWRIRNDNR